MTRKAFTLIETLVAVFILSTALIMAASATNFIVGKLRSGQTAALTTSMRGAFEFINQKMNNANDLAYLTAIKVILGFRGFNDDGSTNDSNPVMLGVVNSNGTDKTCTFVGLRSNRLYAKQHDCNSDAPKLSELDQPLTGAEISINTFELIPANIITNHTETDRIPTMKIKIIGYYNRDPQNKIELQTTYSLDYQTVQRF